MAGASFLSKGGDGATRKVGLSPLGYDDIGSVLEALKLGLDVHQVDFDTLRSYENIKSFDVLFLNCSAAIEPQSAAIAPAVRQYVEAEERFMHPTTRARSWSTPSRATSASA